MADEPKTVKAKVLRDFHLFGEIDKDGKADVLEAEAPTLASLGVIEYTAPAPKKEASRG